MRLIGYHEHLVNRIAVSPSGKMAGSAASDYSVNIWDLEKCELARRLLAHADDVEDFIFISDEIGVSAGRDRRVLLWDLTTGAVLRDFAGHEKDVLSVAYAKGALFTAGDDMTLRMWELETGQLINQWGPFEYETDTCAVDPTRARAILGCDDGRLRVFDIATGRLIREIDAHRSGIKVVVVAPATGDIVSAAYDRRVVVWDGETLNCRVTLEPVPALWERSLAWSPDGHRIVAGTFDGTVIGWSADSARRQFEIGVREGNPCLNAVSVAGDLAVTVADDGYVRLGELSRGVARWAGRAAPTSGRVLANAVAGVARMDVVLVGGHDGVLRTFTLSSGLHQTSAVDLEEGPLNDVAIRVTSHGYEVFVACYSGRVIRLTADNEVIGRWRAHEGAVKALRLVSGKGLGVSCSADGTTASWSLDDGKTIMRFPGHTAIINDIDVDRRGHLVVTVGRDFVANVYVLDEGRLIRTVPLERRSPKAVLLLDERTVLVGDYWGYLVFAPLDGRRSRCVRVASNGISALARRPDGDVLACSYDGSLLLIDCAACEVIGALHAMKQHVERPAVVSGVESMSAAHLGLPADAGGRH